MLLFTAVTLVPRTLVLAGNDAVERTFTEPRAEVERAVSVAKSNSSGKLPALEGFVGPMQRPAERYEKIYYQCIFQVIPSVTGETSVRVTAKITAWYDDPDKQKSGYEVLPSNGRLENDALDRVAQILAGPDGASAKAEKEPKRKYDLSLGPVIPHGPAPGGAGGILRESRPSAIATTSSPLKEEEIQELRNKRVAAERRVQQLNNALQNLQQLYDGQTKPANLVAIRKTGTPLYAHADESGKALFAATAKDQFEMIEIRGDWIHVNISGQSRGWIRRAQVEFPEDAAATKGTGSEAIAESAELFRVIREETVTFPGTWEPLRGKSVKLYSVQTAQSAAETQTREKRDFARKLFERAWKELSTAEGAVAGVVVIFDSADGGQASATTASLRQWREGKIPEAAFWNACSLDPPETFSATSKKK